MTQEIQVETIDSSLASLDIRKAATRKLLESLCEGDAVNIPPEQVLNLLLHNTLNQISLIEATQTLLVEVKKNAYV